MDNLDKILNKEQAEAVRCTEGPLLVLAGAGSGKTRVLTHRVAYLLENCGVMPWNILAITFTNKAAREMRERVNKLSGDRAKDVWVSTFHSMCVRILRRYADLLGYTRDFSIYDTDDQNTVMKGIFKDLNLDGGKLFREREVLSRISSAKNSGTDPVEFQKEAGGNLREKRMADCYLEYEKRLRSNNAMDFDDLLLRSVEVLKKHQEALAYYQERFHYIMVDEYQDTNDIQFQLVYLLAGKYQNICVVGDDDQSIYSFRGANIENILSFEKSWPNAKVIKLEQNYRSTSRILDVANAVIRNNFGRKDKRLWTEKKGGAEVLFHEYPTAPEEAAAIIRSVKDCGRPYHDQAVLYRTNAQSRLLEEQCIKMNVPYQMVGGVNFYQRREIKDILAYMKLIANESDNLSLERIINVPKRGIGETTIAKLRNYALDYSTEDEPMTMYSAVCHAREAGIRGKGEKQMQEFAAFIDGWRERLSASGYMGNANAAGAGTAGPGASAAVSANAAKSGTLAGAASVANTVKSGPGASAAGSADAEKSGTVAGAASVASAVKSGPVASAAGFAGASHGNPEPGSGCSLRQLIESIRDDTGYAKELLSEGKTEAETRFENIEELISKAVSFEQETESPSLPAFLEEVSLISDIDRTDDSKDALTLMTLHGSKGLEFPRVCLAGMSEGLFPGFLSMQSPEAVEEERRLCYVGITRAREELMMTSGRSRMVNGQYQSFPPSRFLKEMPDDLVRKELLPGLDRGRYDSDDGYMDSPGSYGWKGSGNAGHGGFTGGGQSFGRASFEGAGKDSPSSGAGPAQAKSRPGFRRGISNPSDANILAGHIRKGSEIQMLSSLDYAAGDRVSHVKFGEGTVKEIAENKKDFMVTVEFDTAGQKKMLASFAKLKKIG